MAVIRDAIQPHDETPVRPRHRLSRAIVILAVAGLAVLGGYQVWLMAQAVGIAAQSAWTASLPGLASAGIALQSFFHAIALALAQVR